VIGASPFYFLNGESYIKAFMYGGVNYRPVTFLSSSKDECDQKRIVQPSQYRIQLKDGNNSEFLMDVSQSIGLPVWDSISISAVKPTNYRASPEVSNFDRNELEAYIDKPNEFIADTFCLIPNDVSTMDVRIRYHHLSNR
jgi:hypothetical protein